MIIVDAHCDTITRIMEKKEGLYRNSCHLDLERVLLQGSHVQFFAAFIAPEYCQAYAMKRAVQIIDRLYEEVEKNSEYIMLCRNHNEISMALENRKTAAILSIEGGDALQGDISALRIFHRLGVRSICLTWNHRNEIADGVAESITGGGLTAFGREVVKEMNRLGMLIDVSHLSEKGFWDVLEHSSAPVIASHSNAKRICSHRRNLTDEQILALKKVGGVIGINLYPPFLNNDGKADIKDIIKHIEHMLSLGAEKNIGLGADFDGIEETPEDIDGVEGISGILDELLKLNYSEELVKRIAGENFLRIIKEVCR